MPRLLSNVWCESHIPGDSFVSPMNARSSGSELPHRHALRVKNATHPLMQNHRDLCTRLSECFQIPPKAAWNIHKALLHFEIPKSRRNWSKNAIFPGPAFVASSNCAKLGNTVYYAPTTFHPLHIRRFWHSHCKID